MDHLPQSFQHAKLKDGTLRASLKTVEDVEKWLKEYGFSTSTSWIVNSKHPKTNLKRAVFKGSYFCHHSSFQKVDADKNKRGISKNLGCKATVNITIKLTTFDTIRKDEYIQRGLPAVITFKNEHNHSTTSAEALSYLRPTKEMKDTFMGYFNNGNGIKEAMNFHESLLELKYDRHSAEFANALINPKERTVRMWHDVWLHKELGPRSGDGIIQKLQDKQSAYQKFGTIIEIQEDPFAVVVITPIMQRAHKLPFSKDIVFVDSTSSCDAEGHSITFVLTPCSIGAVPLAVIITKGQSTEDYKAGFQLLRQALSESYGGQNYPEIFITDDSDAERKALKEVWPKSQTLLCRFHVCQAVWRWLWNSNHEIEKQDRPSLYNLFQKILIAENEFKAREAFYLATHSKIALKYIHWINHVKKYWERRASWCLAWRRANTHGHQTNNFSEVNVRLFKDIVLLRHKAYNVVSLVDFVCSGMEEYYIGRLRNFINCRNAAPRLFFQALMQKASYIAENDIILDDSSGLYKVPKEGSKLDFHEVDAVSGFCSCSFGALGRFCKHQAAVFFYCNNSLPNAPAVTTESRYAIAQLAFGDKVQPVEFYMSLNESHIESENIKPAIESFEIRNIKPEQVSMDSIPLDSACDDQQPSTSANESSRVKELFVGISENLHLIYEKVGNQHSIKLIEQMEKFVEILKKTPNVNDLNNFLSAANCSKRRVKSSYIRVQPTAISRRPAGMTRGSKRLPVGRPPLDEKTKRRLKRKRSLSENVKKNLPNATKHNEF